MSGLWIYLWVIIFLIQSLLIMLMKSPQGDSVPMAGNLSPALLDLSRETNEQLLALFPVSPAPVNSGATSDKASLLVQREELMLQLEKLGEGSPEGLEVVQLADDLQAWMEMHRKTLDQASGPVELNHYIRSLRSWMVSSLENEQGTRIEEIRLEPDVGAFFPSLYFEVSGDISGLGMTLLSSHDELPDWRLVDLDLQRLPGGTRWWAQGNFRFQNRLLK